MSLPFTAELSAGAGAWASVAALAAAAAWHARRSSAPRWARALRVLGAAAVALAVLRPVLAGLAPRRRLPILPILIDAGSSMRQGAGRATRLEAAKSWLLARRSLIEGRAEPVLYSVAARARRLAGWEELEALKPADAAFEPAQALSEAADDLAGTQAHRAWLLSDGNAERGPGLDAALSALKVPVDAIGVGPPRGGADLAFVAARAPDFAFLHDRVDLAASVEASGLAGGAVLLSLSRREASGDWRRLAQSRLSVAQPYEVLSASFAVTARSLGTERYRLEAQAEGREAAARRRDFQVEILRQKYRILYLAGRPSPGYAALRDFLKADPNRELVSFVILRNPENPSLASDSELSLIPFPAEEIFVRDLPSFDLFIMENFSSARFHLPPAYLASVRSFVAGGGGLLVVGGENAFSLGGYRGTPLEELLPVALSETAPDFVPGLFKPKTLLPAHPLIRLLETPEASAAAWAALPPMDGWARFASVRPGSTVLAVHPQERTAAGEPLPVMALRSYNRGKVLLVSTDSTWRWRLGEGADFRVGGFYARFWSRAIDYLTGTLDLSRVKFAPVADRLAPREPAVFSLRVFDEGFRPPGRGAAEARVLWTPPGGQAREAQAVETEPGVFEVQLTGLAPGEHRLQASARLAGRPWGEDRLSFHWEAAPPETPMDRQWLTALAERSSGVMRELSTADAGELLDRLPEPRLEAETLNRRRPFSAPAWALLAAALLLSEWAWRRLKGLP